MARYKSFRVGLYNAGSIRSKKWVNVDNFLDSLTDTLTSQSNFDYFILLGDFNINILDTNDSKSLRLKQFLTYTNSSNCISEPTHFTRDSATLIDLVITDARVTNTLVKHTPELGGHAFILVDFHLKKPKITPIQQIIRPIKSINMLAFLSDLEAINWDTITGFSCVDQMLSEFSKKISELFDKHAPEKLVTFKKRQLLWFTSNVRYMMQLRDSAHNKYRQTKAESDKLITNLLKD
ncbi:unnamed protein product [Parnassius apollo]|uniref:(apollo) hypothetical protein n=1 Tax=Parnassius apollo TaxID=110799 RepID=A0A8S3XM73_PARAO|nr:unnamed protein product [Parnassius apollo]